MLSPIVEKFLQTLADAPTLAVAHERLALARELLEKMDRENARLQGEVAELQRELSLRVPREFAEHRGVLWKRLPAGGVAEDAYCPTHRLAMSNFAGELICTVKNCGYAAPFNSGNVQHVRSQIPQDA